MQYSLRMITEPSVDKYIRNLIPERDAVLREIEELAARDKIPIVGPVVGTLLSQLARSIRATRVFELGSAIGYSTIWLARAVGPGGKVYYTDGDPDNARAAQNYFLRAGLADRIELRVGDALESFAAVPGEFDLIFNDVDKEGYPDVYRQAASRVRPGGFFVSDNTLRRGNVADPTQTGGDLEPVRLFNDLLARDSRFETALLPLRDGVTVAFRLH
ncbi:MAG TPA: O-methyltransferase [Terriglobia bacterium]|nr:O-methyltransferase [Terriglobia bacterium]